MKEEQFQRLIRLARSTGSPLIVADGSDEGIVILPVSQYEALVEPDSSEAMPPKEIEMPAPPSPPPTPSVEPIPPEPIPEPPPEVETQFYLEPVE